MQPFLHSKLQIGENADTNEEADRVSTELLKNAEITINNANDVISKLERERGCLEDTRSSIDGRRHRDHGSANYSHQDAEKAKFKDLEFKSRKQEEDQSRALGKTNEKLSQLEAQRKEDVDRLNEKLGQLKTRTSEEVKELNEKLRQAQTDHSNVSDELSMKTAKLDNMIIEKSNERVMASLTRSSVTLAGAKKRTHSDTVKHRKHSNIKVENSEYTLIHVKTQCKNLSNANL